MQLPPPELKNIFFKLGTRKFHFLKCKKFFQSGLFQFFELSKFSPDIKVFLKSSVFQNVRNTFFFSESKRSFLVFELDSSISQNIRKPFFFFGENIKKNFRADFIFQAWAEKWLS